jgi:hypothetical protein
VYKKIKKIRVPKGQHPFQSSSLVKPHTAGEVVSTPSSNAKNLMWKCHRLVCHDLLDVVHGSKMTNFGAEFELREEEEVIHVRRIWGLRNH